MTNAAVHIIITDLNKNKTLADAYFSPVAISSDSYKNKQYSVYTDSITYSKDDILNFINIRVSVIDTIECYINSTLKVN